MSIFIKKLSADDGREIYDMLQGIESNDNGFHNDVKDMPYLEFSDWLKMKEGFSNGIGLLDWMVPETYFWLYCDSVPVGNGRIRHYLNDALKIDGGNIGYAISFPHRGKGYGNEMLRLLLDECEKMGIHEVHIGANKDNERSCKVILRNGGVLCRESESKNYYICKV